MQTQNHTNSDAFGRKRLGAHLLILGGALLALPLYILLLARKDQGGVCRGLLALHRCQLLCALAALALVLRCVGLCGWVGGWVGRVGVHIHSLIRTTWIAHRTRARTETENPPLALHTFIHPRPIQNKQTNKQTKTNTHTATGGSTCTRRPSSARDGENPPIKTHQKSKACSAPYIN
jgi:hypothetical protein